LFNIPLNAELNPICHLLALLGARHIFHFSRVSDIQLETLKYINYIINCNIDHIYFFPCDLMYVQLQTLKYINCIINCNIFPYSYFHHVLLLHILFIFIFLHFTFHWS